MTRIIRTEYVQDLEKIVAFQLVEGVSIERIERMRLIVHTEAVAQIQAEAFVHPPTTIVSAGYSHIHLEYRTSDEVKALNKVWDKISTELYEGRYRHRGYMNSIESFKNAQEHARIQLEWAKKDVSSSTTVNISKYDHQMFLAGLNYINWEKWS